jgi:hypothetical protein
MRGVSGRNCRNQRLDVDNVHDPCRIVGEHAERHLGGDFWQRLIKKCVAPTRAFIVPNGCSTVSRRWRMACGFASRRSCTASSRCSCTHRYSYGLTGFQLSFH